MSREPGGRGARPCIVANQTHPDGRTDGRTDGREGLLLRRRRSRKNVCVQPVMCGTTKRKIRTKNRDNALLEVFSAHTATNTHTHKSGG
jgi:hypothetical protein